MMMIRHIPIASLIIALLALLRIPSQHITTSSAKHEQPQPQLQQYSFGGSLVVDGARVPDESRRPYPLLRLLPAAFVVSTHHHNTYRRGNAHDRSTFLAITTKGQQPYHKGNNPYPHPAVRFAFKTKQQEEDDDEQSTPTTAGIPSNFNPFDYSGAIRSGIGGGGTGSTGDSSFVSRFNTDSDRGSPVSSNRGGGGGDSRTNLISLRQMRMKQITNRLLQEAERITASSSQQQSVVVTSALNIPNDTMNEILQENVDFLLDPLENDDAVLEPDSIYNRRMTRSERYDAYRNSMNERISKARNETVKLVLQALKTFILSHE